MEREWGVKDYPPYRLASKISLNPSLIKRETEKGITPPYPNILRRPDGIRTPPG
jgi:hypothetical protein